MLTEDKAKSTAPVSKLRETQQGYPATSLGASLVDGVRRIEQSDRSGGELSSKQR